MFPSFTKGKKAAEGGGEVFFFFSLDKSPKPPRVARQPPLTLIFTYLPRPFIDDCEIIMWGSWRVRIIYLLGGGVIVQCGEIYMYIFLCIARYTESRGWIFPELHLDLAGVLG